MPPLHRSSVDFIASEAASEALARGGDPKQASHDARTRAIKGAQVTSNRTTSASTTTTTTSYYYYYYYY